MEKYYILRGASEPKIIGVRDGIRQAEIYKSGFSNKEEYDRIFHYLGSSGCFKRIEEEPNFEIELQSVRLLKSAIITDFLQYGPYLLDSPFLISDKVKSVLVKHNVQYHRLFNANLVSKSGQLLSYSLFYCPPLNYDVIDFEHSIMYRSDDIFSKNELNIKSMIDYIDFKNKVSPFIKFGRIALNNKFDQSHDLFILRPYEIFISEKLYREIIDLALTGVNLLPAFGANMKWPTIQLPKDNP